MTGDKTNAPITPREWLDLLVERGADLRKVGVTRVEIAGCVADLAPHVDDVNAELLERIAELEAAAEGKKGDDPLSRATTFGGDRVPSWGRGQ